jgi:hypothetical protein
MIWWSMAAGCFDNRPSRVDAILSFLPPTITPAHQFAGSYEKQITKLFEGEFAA